MLIFVGILTAILVFSIIILVHEYGHFKTARIFKVKVEEFGLGIPPKARKIWTDKHGTEYTLNWLPLGGFVRLKGENIHTFSAYDKDSLQSKPAWQQAIIMLAGICMNFLLAVFIFSILFFIGVGPVGVNNIIQTNSDLKLIPTPEKALEIGLIIENPGVYLLPVEDSIAKKSGIQDYDLVVKANENKINNYIELKDIIGGNVKTPMSLEIQRSLDNCDITKNQNCNFENISLEITPNEEGKIGSYLIPNTQINKYFKYDFTLGESIKYGFTETYGQIILTFKGIGMIGQKIFAPKTPSERQEALNQVTGPIGMVDFMSKTISNGILFIMIIGAIISINLGVFNLLPIPALDGGRFLLITINSIIKKIFGKKAISDNLEGILHVGFFILLISLSVIIAYNDINKIINN